MLHLSQKLFCEDKRSDSSFDQFYEAVVTASQYLTDEPVLPRRRKLPARLDDGAPSYHPSTLADLYRQKYFEALDVVCEESKRRFDQQDLKIVVDMESLLIDSANGLTLTVPESITAMYRRDLDKERLAVHLKMLPDVIKQYGMLLVCQSRESPSSALCVML